MSQDKYDFNSYDGVKAEAQSLMGKCYAISHKVEAHTASRAAGKEIANLVLEYSLERASDPETIRQVEAVRVYINENY